MSGSSLTLHPAPLRCGLAHDCGVGARRVRAAAAAATRRTPRRADADAAPSLVGAILAAHAAALWGLLQIREVRERGRRCGADVRQPDRAPNAPKPVVRRRRLRRRVPQPTPKRPPPVLIAAAPSPAPAPFVVPAPPPDVPRRRWRRRRWPAPVAAPQPPAPPPAPKVIPASAVQYLGDPPVPEYPRLSIRAGETGRVMLRIYIDEAGLPRTVQVERSSGHARLDEAGAVGDEEGALQALHRERPGGCRLGVRPARFRIGEVTVNTQIAADPGLRPFHEPERRRRQVAAGDPDRHVGRLVGDHGGEGPDAGAAQRPQPRVPQLLLERDLARGGGRRDRRRTARAIRSRT